MAQAEHVRGRDVAKVAKFNGLPSPENRIVETAQPDRSIPFEIGRFNSTMGSEGIEMNPLLSASIVSDVTQKPKFVAKITLFDDHSDDNY